MMCTRDHQVRRPIENGGKNEREAKDITLFVPKRSLQFDKYFQTLCIISCIIRNYYDLSYAELHFKDAFG